MTVVVGHLPRPDGHGALDLGLRFARARGEPMLVVTVVPRQWSTPSPARVDAEFGEYARRVGAEAAASAGAYLAAAGVDVPVSYRAVPGRSVASTLVEVVQEAGGTVLVVGGTADAPPGRIGVGTTAQKLLHAAPVGVALAPRDRSPDSSPGSSPGSSPRGTPDGRPDSRADSTVDGTVDRAVDSTVDGTVDRTAGFGRLTVAFSDSESSVRTVAATAELAARLGVALRVASFGVRNPTMYPPEVGLHAEDSVLDSWADQAVEAQRRLVSGGIVGAGVPRVIGTGTSWDEAVAAVDWRGDELLVVGSSDSGPLARVFLGSRASKLIRAAPVPVLVLPHPSSRS
ncbi:universal stress protein [Pseudonocardia sp. NPDC049635]|uniref:universal stress protein n=1 Tax=Pseudonocardia sp. NPDC049635 TaxID=3155506 RepID=UPI00340B936B